MTSTSGSRVPDDDKDQSSGTGSSQPKDAPGVELGMSEKSGGTFEPEEVPEEGVEPDG